jgi:hypothetical protein
MTEKKVSLDIEMVEDNASLLKPSIVVFPNNHPRLEDLNQKTEWGMFVVNDKKMKHERLLLGKNDRMYMDGKNKTFSNNSE